MPGATPIYSAEGVLSLDASRLQGGVNQARSSLGSLYSVIRDNWWGVKNVGLAFEGMGAAIVGGVGASVKAAADFEQGMIGVARTSGIADETGKQYSADLKTLSDQLREIARTKPVNLSVVTDIAEQAGALGIAKENIASFTSGIVDLVATTNLTPDTAAKLARVANVFNYTQPKQFQQLDSAVYSLGVNSAATESEIVNMSTRLAGFGHQAGLSSAEVTALAATTISLGQRPYSATTALQRTFEGLATAASKGGPLLNDFAAVAGTTADKFKQLIINDPNEALTQFLEGLGKHSGNLVQANEIFDKLGIHEQLQIQALQALASGTKDGATSWNNYRYASDQANAAFEKGTVVQDAAAKQYQSASNQLKILGNTIRDTAIGFGDLFLPELKLATKLTNDFFTGIEALPAPVRVTAGVLGSLGGIIALAMGSFLMFGQRIVLAKNEFKLLSDTVRANAAAAIEASVATAAAEDRAAGSSLAAAVAAGRTAKARGVAALETANEARAAELDTVALVQNEKAENLAALAAIRRAEAEVAASEGDVEAAATATLAAVAFEEQAAAAATAAGAAVAEGAALTEEAATAGIAEVAAYGLGAAIDFMLGPIGIAILVIGALTAAVAWLGHSHKDGKTAADEYAKAQDDIVQAVKREETGVKGAVAAILAKKLAESGAIGISNEFGISIGTLSDMIRGINSASAVQAIQMLSAAAKNGNPDAQKLLDITGDLNQQLVASVKVANDTAAADEALGAADDSASNSALNLQDATQKKTDAIEKANQAIIDLVQAEQGEKDGAQSVAQAEQDYQDALNGANDAAVNLRKAEDDLTEAQIEQRKAAQAVTDAQKKLSTARADAIAQERKDEQSLKGAQLEYYSGLLREYDAEQALDKLRKGPTLEDFVKATNELRDAQDSLYDSQVKASDAQWQLNYLISEGASARDIADAQNQLREANDKVADSTVSVYDKEQALNVLRQGGDKEALAKAEIDYQQALLATERNLQTLQDAQDTLQTDRDNIATDKAYRDAEDELRDAQVKLRGATDKVTQATRTLHHEQNGMAQDQRIQAAQASLVDAYFQQAQNIASVKEQTALAAGQNVTAADKANYLADALDQMAGQASGPVADQLRSYADQLRAATPESRNTKVTADTSQANKATKQYYAEDNKQLQDQHSKHHGFWSDVGHWISYADDAHLKKYYTDANDFSNKYLVNPTKNFFVHTLPSVGDKAWDAVSGAAKKAYHKAEDVWDDLPGFFSKIGKAAANGLANAVIKGINGIVGVWNGFIDMVSGFSFGWDAQKVAGFTVFPAFHMSMGFMNDLKIPTLGYIHLAEGGIAMQPTFAMVGDNGPAGEAVIPLDRLYNMFAPVEQMVLEMMRTNQGLRELTAALGGSTNIDHQGNVYHVSSVNGASAQEVVDELLWHELAGRR